MHKKGVTVCAMLCPVHTGSFICCVSCPHVQKACDIDFVNSKGVLITIMVRIAIRNIISTMTTIPIDRCCYSHHHFGYSSTSANSCFDTVIVINVVVVAGTVMKRFDSSKLFKLACQDVVERFHLLISMLFVLVSIHLCALHICTICFCFLQ